MLALALSLANYSTERPKLSINYLDCYYGGVKRGPMLMLRHELLERLTMAVEPPAGWGIGGSGGAAVLRASAPPQRGILAGIGRPRSVTADAV